MATYPLMLKPSFSYEDHLMFNNYIADINNGIKRVSTDIVKGQALSTKIISETLSDNLTILRETVVGNSEEINSNLERISNQIEFGLAEVGFGIEELRASFDIGMGMVISQFEMLRQDIQKGLKSISALIENRRKTEAFEHFRDAMDFYKDGCRFVDMPNWFDDALRHFLLSVEQYERNPLAHLFIGHIYHYQKDHRDFNKSIKHYQLAYIYGIATDDSFPIASQGYFYSGWLEAAHFNKYDNAITLTKKALEYDPNLSEAYYHLAKFYAIQNNAEESMSNLKKVIIDFDRNYAIKANSDPDFNHIRIHVNNLLVDLKENAKKAFSTKLADYAPENIAFNEEYSKKYHVIEIKYDSNRNDSTYFEYLDGLKALDSINSFYSKLLKEKNEMERKKNEMERIQPLIAQQKCTSCSADLTFWDLDSGNVVCKKCRTYGL